jgi:radical SAM protein with 4Fe4S-binding SPASM domain
MGSWPLKVMHAGGRVLKAHAGRLSHPLKINLCLTYWCQYRCQTCNIWKRKPEDELTTDELLRFAASNTFTEWLDVTGGEIFLRPDVETVLDAILGSWKRLALLHFPTNGFLTDKIVPVAERLARRHTTPLIITVSLDGDEALNDQIRGIKGGYQRQVETFRRLRSAGLHVVLGMTVSRFNATRVRDVFDAVRKDVGDLRPAEFHLNVAQSSTHYYGTDDTAAFGASREEIVGALDAYRELRGTPWRPADLLEARYLQLLRSFVDTGVTPLPCHALRSSCFIDPWGTVYPCISYGRPIGRLREHDMRLEPIWRGETAGTVQGEIWSGDCPQCWTACEAYQTILGNALAPWRSGRPRPAPVPEGAAPSVRTP